jgi:tetratricopeptide (TPR) repeat protein
MSTDTDVRTIIELEALPAALASLLEAAIQKPGDAALQVSLAAAALQAGRIHIFETALAKALEIDPQNLPALQLLAKLNLEMGNVANAAKTYFKILQQDKINVEALLGLGLCFFKQGNQDMARKSFERVLRQQPNHLLAQENLRAMQSPIVVTSHPSKPDYSNLIDLKPFFEGVDDYAVLKLPEHFPNYRDHSDLDILCRDHRSFLRHIQRCAKSYAERGFKVQVHAEQGHCHVDFYAPGATRLNFRFDLMESLVDFAKFSVSPVFEKGVLDYRREVVQNSVRVLVPRLTDDLAVRCLEYLAWRDVRPEKIAHWHYLERAGNWQFLEVVSRHTNLNLSVDIASGRRPVLKASQKPQRRPAEVTAVTEMLKPVSRASPMTLEEYLAPENCDTTIASRRPRLDYFMIWGHGTQHTREILEIIRRQKSVEIVAIHKKFVADIAKFVSDIYSSDAVPLEHLAAKTRYLLKTPPEIVLILTRNLDPQERFYGEGAFRHIQCARIKAIKEDIRDQCNPRQDGKRMEDHVIHASDFESQTEHVLEILSLPPVAYFTRRPNRDLDGPYHLPPFENYALHEVPLESLRANILGQGLVPIIQTPHYRYVRGEQESYRAYHAAHFGKEFTDDHLPENFDRLMASFDSSRFSEIGNKSFIVAVKEPDQNYRILDGVHRAAILQHRNVKSVLIVEPLYNDVSRAGANQVLITQPASRVGTARRAVRGRLGEATLPKSDLPPSRAPQNDESSPPVKRFKAAALVFSKDRPLQLDGALRSWKRHCRDAASTKVKVLYKASSSRLSSLYARLKQEHPDVDFVREGDFRRDVLTLLRDENYVLFAVDDTVFIRDFAMADIVGALDRHPEALGFSLRLGTQYNLLLFDEPRAEFAGVRNSGRQSFKISMARCGL